MFETGGAGRGRVSLEGDGGCVDGGGAVVLRECDVCEGIPARRVMGVDLDGLKDGERGEEGRITWRRGRREEGEVHPYDRRLRDGWKISRSSGRGYDFIS